MEVSDLIILINLKKIKPKYSRYGSCQLVHLSIKVSKPNRQDTQETLEGQVNKDRLKPVGRTKVVVWPSVNQVIHSTIKACYQCYSNSKKEWKTRGRQTPEFVSAHLSLLVCTSQSQAWVMFAQSARLANRNQVLFWYSQAGTRLRSAAFRHSLLFIDR